LNLPNQSFLFSDGKWKVSDYYFKKISYCCKYEKYVPEKTLFHTYRSPELLENKTLTEKCDIWSFGLLFYRLNFGYLPWMEENMKPYLKMIRSFKMKFPDDMVISKESKEIMRKYIEIDRNNILRNYFRTSKLTLNWR
jgi:serine/threonine protein kinase